MQSEWKRKGRELPLGLGKTDFRVHNTAKCLGTCGSCFHRLGGLHHTGRVSKLESSWEVLRLERRKELHVL